MMCKFIRLFLCVSACAIQLASLHAADWYVDNVKGDDRSGDGSAAKPFQTIARAFKDAKTSDAMYLTPNAAPYTEQVDIPVGGTAEKPFIFDGRGSVINRLTHYTADKWKDEGTGIYSMHLPNNAHVMDKQWWGFDLVFFDGKAGKNCASREELVPLGYFLFKYRALIDGKEHPLQNTLFVKLPDAKTPADIKVEAPGVYMGLGCGKPYVVIRNITAMYCTGDGFDSWKAEGIVFERVRGCYNMDQGISHHGSKVTVRDSRFDHNAGCGIVDVYPEVKVKYERCLIEDDTYRGGVELLGGEFVMEDCVIRANPKKALNVDRPGVSATLRNCLFIGPKDGNAEGIINNQGRELTLDRCTIYHFKTGLRVRPDKLKMVNCAFISCDLNYDIGKPGKADQAQDIAMDYNFFEPKPFVMHGVKYQPEQWAKMQTETGYESHSIMRELIDSEVPWTLPSLKGKGRDGSNIGACLDPASFLGSWGK